VWLFLLAMLALFAALVLAIREKAAEPRSFWTWIAVSFGIILIGGAIGWLI